MNLEEIQNEWSIDSRIDPTELGLESAKTASVHSKYLKELIAARLSLVQLLKQKKRLRFEKWEWLTTGPFKDDTRGWKFPPSGQILKGDIPTYLDGDPDILEIEQKIGYTETKVETLVSILKQINDRQWQIRNSIEWVKFKAGNG